MSNVEEFAALLQGALSAAIGPDTVKVAVSGSSESEGEQLSGFTCTVTLGHDVEFSAPTEKLTESSAEQLHLSAVHLAVAIARQVAEPLNELAVSLATAGPSAFIADDQLSERVEEMLNKAEEVASDGAGDQG